MSEVEEIERSIQFILSELQECDNIECPNLKEISRNYLRVLLRRALSKLIEAKARETENSSENH